LTHISCLPSILGQAPNAVSAHLRLGAVWLKKPHPQVRPGAATHKEDAISTDAEVAGAAEHGKLALGSLRNLFLAHLIH